MRRAKGPGDRFGEVGSVSSTYKSAVVIIPPQSCWTQIQDIRAEHDKAYDRWMPHINLIYPYMEDVSNVYHTESQKLCKHLGTLEPFRVAFTKDSIGQFVHGRTSTIWVKPLRPSGDDENYSSHVTRSTTQAQNRRKKTKLVSKMVKKQVPQTSVYHAPQVSTAGVVEVTGYPLPISGPMKNYESSLDRLARAEWTPDTCSRQPLKEILQYGPGLDCLRYAEWTPENTKQPMFTQTVHKTQAYVTMATQPADVTTSVSEERYEYVEEEVTDSEDEYTEDFGGDDDSVNDYYSDPTASHPSVIELQAKLQDVYPTLNELSTKSPDGFQPHLTLGQDTRGRLMEQVRRTWRNLVFDVKEIYLISRENDRTPFKIKKTIPLGAFLDPE